MFVSEVPSEIGAITCVMVGMIGLSILTYISSPAIGSLIERNIALALRAFGFVGLALTSAGKLYAIAAGHFLYTMLQTQHMLVEVNVAGEESEHLTSA